MGNSSPKRAWTFSPSRALGSWKTRLMDGSSTVVPPKSSRSEFSSGTQSKHHPKFFSLRSRSHTSFIHCPPHGAGSKNGTTRNGRAVAWRKAERTAAPSTMRGWPGIVVSRTWSQRPIRSRLRRSHTRQSVKNARLYCRLHLSEWLAVPRLAISFRRMRICASQRGMSAYTRRSLGSAIRLAAAPTTSTSPSVVARIFARSVSQAAGSRKSPIRKLQIVPNTGSSPPLNRSTMASISFSGRNASAVSTTCAAPSGFKPSRISETWTPA